MNRKHKLTSKQVTGECRRCHGSGYLRVDLKIGWRYVSHTAICPDCNGTGLRGKNA